MKVKYFNCWMKRSLECEILVVLFCFVLFLINATYVERLRPTESSTGGAVHRHCRGQGSDRVQA